LYREVKKADSEGVVNVEGATRVKKTGDKEIETVSVREVRQP